MSRVRTPALCADVAAKGHVRVTITDARGHIVEQFEQRNLVVTAGRNLLRDFLNNTAPTGLTHIALGTDATASDATQTALVAEVYRDLITSRATDVGQLTLTLYLGTTQANGNTLREVGLFNAASLGTMYARVPLASSIAKTSAIAVTFTWTLTFTV